MDNYEVELWSVRKFADESHDLFLKYSNALFYLGEEMRNYSDESPLEESILPFDHNYRRLLDMRDLLRDLRDFYAGCESSANAVYEKFVRESNN